MATDNETPIVIGVGDFKNGSTQIAGAIEPMQLMLQASLRALEDATSMPSLKEELQSKIDSVNVVATWTWPYADLPGLLSQKLGVRPKHKVYSEHGGNQPVKLFDEAARRISRGESRVTLITGGEALASRKNLTTTDNKNADAYGAEQSAHAKLRKGHRVTGRSQIPMRKLSSLSNLVNPRTVGDLNVHPFAFLLKHRAVL